MLELHVEDLHCRLSTFSRLYLFLITFFGLLAKDVVLMPRKQSRLPP